MKPADKISAPVSPQPPSADPMPNKEMLIKWCKENGDLPLNELDWDDVLDFAHWYAALAVPGVPPGEPICPMCCKPVFVDVPARAGVPLEKPTCAKCGFAEDSIYHTDVNCGSFHGFHGYGVEQRQPMQVRLSNTCENAANQIGLAMNLAGEYRESETADLIYAFMRDLFHEVSGGAATNPVGSPAEPLNVVRELVEHGHCPNCGCDQWNTAGCPICPLMRKAHGVLVQAGERKPKEFAAYMEADEINKRNMARTQSAGPPEPETFAQTLAHAVNRHSRENGSDTPDWILADYLENCLIAYNAAVCGREKWYGRLCGNGRGISPSVPPASEAPPTRDIETFFQAPAPTQPQEKKS